MFHTVVLPRRIWKVSMRSWTRSMSGTEVVSFFVRLAARLSNPVLTLSHPAVLVISHDSTVRLHCGRALDGHESDADCPSFPMRPTLAYSSSTREFKTASVYTQIYFKYSLVSCCAVSARSSGSAPTAKPKSSTETVRASSSRSFTYQYLLLIRGKRAPAVDKYKEIIVSGNKTMRPTQV